MSRTRSTKLWGWLLPIALVIGAVVIAGCGSDSSDGGNGGGDGGEQASSDSPGDVALNWFTSDDPDFVCDEALSATLVERESANDEGFLDDCRSMIEESGSFQDAAVAQAEAALQDVPEAQRAEIEGMLDQMRNITVVDESVDGDTATVQLGFEADGEGGEVPATAQMDLEKDGDSWKVVDFNSGS